MISYADRVMWFESDAEQRLLVTHEKIEKIEAEVRLDEGRR